jgi:hypothetical protein
MIRQLKARVSRIEKRMPPKDDGTCTLEEFCRFMWRRNPARCVELSEEPGDWIFRSYIPMFEREDAERSQLARSR